MMGDRIRIIKVDVDKYGVTASQYGIQSVHTLMLYSFPFSEFRKEGFQNISLVGIC